MRNPRKLLRAVAASLTVAALGATGIALALPGGQPATAAAAAATGAQPERASSVSRQSGAQGYVRTADVPVQVRIGTFNILSSWHTRVGRGEAWMAPGPMRAHLAAEAVRLYDADVVGFQELDADQMGPMPTALPDYAFYPGNSLGAKGVNNTIGWNKTKFDRVSGGYFTVVFLGEDRHVPFVKLRHKATGQEFWVLNTHNTPKRGGDPRLTKEREKQVAQEIAKVKQLQKDGLPVLMTGDLNDKDWTYCQIVTQTSLRPAQGFPGGCKLPNPSRIDWVFGSRVSWQPGATFDRGPLVSRVTDHHVMFATATLR